MTLGLAMALFSTDWMSAPATPSAAPASTAAAVRGSRTKHKMRHTGSAASAAHSACHSRAGVYHWLPQPTLSSSAAASSAPSAATLRLMPMTLASFL